MESKEPLEASFLGPFSEHDRSLTSMDKHAFPSLIAQKTASFSLGFRPKSQLSFLRWAKPQVISVAGTATVSDTAKSKPTAWIMLRSCCEGFLNALSFGDRKSAFCFL
jgi:hypothetical protein